MNNLTDPKILIPLLAAAVGYGMLQMQVKVMGDQLTELKNDRAVHTRISKMQEDIHDIEVWKAGWIARWGHLWSETPAIGSGQ